MASSVSQGSGEGGSPPKKDSARGNRSQKSDTVPPRGGEVGSELGDSAGEGASVGTPHPAGEHRPRPRLVQVADRW